MFMSNMTTEGASFAVYSVIIGSDLEHFRSSIIVESETELLSLGYQDMVLRLSRRFGKPDLGLL